MLPRQVVCFTADTSSNLLDHNNWQKVVLDASQLNEKEIKTCSFQRGIMLIVPKRRFFLPQQQWCYCPPAGR